MFGEWRNSRDFLWQNTTDSWLDLVVLGKFLINFAQMLCIGHHSTLFPALMPVSCPHAFSAPFFASGINGILRHSRDRLCVVSQLDACVCKLHTSTSPYGNLQHSAFIFLASHTLSPCVVPLTSFLSLLPPYQTNNQTTTQTNTHIMDAPANKRQSSEKEPSRTDIIDLENEDDQSEWIPKPLRQTLKLTQQQVRQEALAAFSQWDAWNHCPPMPLTKSGMLSPRLWQKWPLMPSSKSGRLSPRL